MVTARPWTLAGFAARKATARTGRMLFAGTVARRSTCRRSGIRAGAILSACRRITMAAISCWTFPLSLRPRRRFLSRIWRAAEAAEQAPRGESLQQSVFSAEKKTTRDNQRNSSLRTEYLILSTESRRFSYNHVSENCCRFFWTPYAPQTPHRGGAGSRHGSSHRGVKRFARCGRPVGERISEPGREFNRHAASGFATARNRRSGLSPCECRRVPAGSGLAEIENDFLAQQYHRLCTRSRNSSQCDSLRDRQSARHAHLACHQSDRDMGRPQAQAIRWRL